jgi:oligosaccharyltransferase complex subunit delta (ribophorin II)
MLSRPLDLITSLVFFGSLAGIEYVFYLYWTHVTLFPVLQYLGALSVVAFFSGRSALSAVQVRRLQRTATPAKKDS